MKMSRMWGIKKKSSPKPFDFELLAMPVVGVEPTRVISTRDFEFSSPSLIWCHPVLSNDTPFPARISIFTHLRSIKHQIFDFSLRFPSAPIL